jgi:hypothetical protein
VIVKSSALNTYPVQSDTETGKQMRDEYDQRKNNKCTDYRLT